MVIILNHGTHRMHGKENSVNSVYSVVRHIWLLEQ